MDDHRVIGTPVKVYTRLDSDGLTDSEAEALYERVQANFWQELDELTQADYGTGVHADGRSGGWAVPDEPIEEGDLQDQWVTDTHNLLKRYINEVWPAELKAELDAKAERERVEQSRAAVLIVGNVVDGVEIFGPYESVEDAQGAGELWAGRHTDWNVTTVCLPEELGS